MEQLAGSDLAKERVKAVLETVAGSARLQEVCARLDICEQRFHQLRQEILEGALSAAEPGLPDPTVVRAVRLLADFAADPAQAKSADLLAQYEVLAPNSPGVYQAQLAVRERNIRRSIHNFSLLSQALGKEFTQCLEVKLLEQGELFWGQMLQGVGVLQPCHNLVEDLLRRRDPLERLFEGKIVRVVIADILDQERARQRIEALQRGVSKTQAEGLHQDTPFGESHWNLMATQSIEEVKKHASLSLIHT